ncbi:unnamed protein product, partial [Discosporangium mesarthrocarpum]
MADRRWLVSLALFMAHTREFQGRHTAALHAFHPNRFRSEWELFWELVDGIGDSVEGAIVPLMRWERPLSSLAVMVGLLLISWYDVVHLLLPLSMVGGVACIMVWDVSFRKTSTARVRAHTGATNSGGGNGGHKRGDSSWGPVLNPWAIHGCSSAGSDAGGRVSPAGTETPRGTRVVPRKCGSGSLRTVEANGGHVASLSDTAGDEVVGMDPEVGGRAEGG